MMYKEASIKTEVRSPHIRGFGVRAMLCGHLVSVHIFLKFILYHCGNTQANWVYVKVKKCDFNGHKMNLH